MSGTSADGADAVLASFEGTLDELKWEVRAHRHRAYPDSLRRRVLAAAGSGAGLRQGAHLHTALGAFFASLLQELLEGAGVDRARIEAVGLHGQTLYHHPDGPEPVSVQSGSAAVVAERLGCDVICDFRSRDIAAGGQGAPLVPFADAWLLRRPDRDRAALNLGGIANVTWLPAGRGTGGVLAFDTGPANMVLDEVVRRAGGGTMGYDREGEGARRGRVIGALLREWSAHPFFSRLPPRSAGREQFGAAFVDPAWERWAGEYPAEDLLATAVALTCWSIKQAWERWLPVRTPRTEVIVSGGGARNRFLVEQLSRHLAPAVTGTSEELLGISSTAREALAFALLADAFTQGIPAGLPAVTGARHPVPLGVLVPGGRPPGPPWR